jgi:uncharacterized protein (TIGR02118 family)
MYQLFASYAHPADPDAFLQHYREKHVPIAQSLPKARFYGWQVCESPDGSRPPHFVVSVLQWDSREDALAALSSPAGEAAVGDLKNFAGAGVDLDLGDVENALG